MVSFVAILAITVPLCMGLRQDAFGTKTLYEWIQPLTAKDVIDNDLMNTVTAPNTSCKAVHVTAVYRHGARYPSSGDIADMNRLHENIKHNTACMHDVVRNWTNPFAAKQAFALSNIGAFEQQGLGNRFGKRFLSLLENKTSAIQFISSHKKRSIDSAINFVAGMKTTPTDRPFSLNIGVEDMLMRFYDNCTLFQISVKHNKTARRQTTLYENGRHVKNITQNINDKLCSGKVTVHPALLLGYSETLRADLFGSHTPYRWIQPYTLNINQNQYINVRTKHNDTCSTVHATLILRHGTRNPSIKEILGMDKLHEVIRSRTTAEHDAIRSWTNPFHVREAMELSSSGSTEHIALGERFGSGLYSLLKNKSAFTQYISSSYERCLNSSFNFDHGLQSIVKNHIGGEITLDVNNALLRFYDDCSIFQTSVKNNISAHLETILFERSIFLRNISEGISRKLFRGQFTLSPEDVILMAEYCAYELALYNSSVWCDLFEDWQQPVFEYLMDIDKYWEWAYGHKINYEQSCPLISDIFQHMDTFMMPTPSAKRYSARFMFGHGETILPLTTVLGLFKDDVPLRADNFHSHEHRKFVVSQIAPFAANVAFILYKCEQQPKSNLQEDYRVKIMVNEKEVTVPGFNNTLHPYHMLRKKLEQYIDHCEFDILCKNKQDPSIVG